RRLAKSRPSERYDFGDYYLLDSTATTSSPRALTPNRWPASWGCCTPWSASSRGRLRPGRPLLTPTPYPQPRRPVGAGYITAGTEFGMDETKKGKDLARHICLGMFEAHRGAFPRRNELVVFGNDGYAEDERARREVDATVTWGKENGLEVAD